MKNLNNLPRWTLSVAGVMTILLWFCFFSLKLPFNWGDIIFEGMYLMIIVISYLFIIRLKINVLEIGWSIFIYGLLIDFLDEFTKEPALLNTYIEGLLTSLGLGLVAVGLYFSQKKLQNEFAKSGRAEEALAHERDLLHALMDNVPDTIYFKDAASRFMRINTAQAQVLGLNDPQKAIGKMDLDFFTTEHARDAYLDEQKIVQSGQPLIAKVEKIRRADGEFRWVSATKVPIRDKEGEVSGIVGISRDITEQKRAEEDKEKLQAQLLQSQKMEAIGRLAGGVAHDFNNLLTAILGYGELLLHGLDDHDPLHQDVEQIMKAGQRAASLTRQLLAFSRLQALQPQVLDLNATVADMGKMLRRLIGEDIDLVTVLGPGLERVKVDPGRIEQVIMNLAVNARDAMPQGGRLTIKTENVILDKAYCQVLPDARPGKFVCLSVEDTGVGIDEEITQHIFEPFFSTKGEEGTGLGLAVVYGIVRQHEGWINVYSEPGQGSTFKVYLPAFSVESEEDGAEEMISLQELQGRGERLLVVEDDPGVRELARRTLGENGYVVFEATSAAQALDIFEREKGDFHLVFSDMVLPDGDGLQLIDQLLARNAALKVVLSSGYTARKSKWPLVCERGFQFLEKPYASATLLRVVRETIEPRE